MPYAFAAVLLLSAPAAPQSLALSLESAAHPQFSIAGLTLRLTSLGGGPALLSIDKLTVAGSDLGSVRLRCAKLKMAPGSVECAAGELAHGKADALPARFRYRSGSDWEVEVVPRRGERWHVQQAGASVRVRLDGARIERLAPVVPALARYHVTGIASGSARLQDAEGNARVSADIALRNVKFNDAAGDHAGEQLSARFKASAHVARGEWRWQGELRWVAGELYLKPFYLAEGEHRLEAHGRTDGRRIRVDSAALDLAGVGTLQLMEADWDRKRSALRSARFETTDLDLGAAGQLLVRPLLEQRALPSVALTGKARIAGEWDGSGLSRLDVNLAGVTAQGARGMRLADVSGKLPWRRDASTAGRLQVAHGALGRVPLGAFDLSLKMHGFAAELARAEIPLLDGSIVIDGAKLARRDEEWQWQISGSLYPVSLQAVTAALGVPQMKGTVSASIPRVTHGRATVATDGALVIQAFDGYIAMNNLRIVEPFGRVPRLYADLDIRHLDLEQITETFSFGSITGFVDASVNDLELIGWKPSRFDARIESSPGRYRKRISQRAVENITALGGAGATAAIQRSLLRFFDEFGYSMIGLSCRLAGGVCRMDGIEPAPPGYVIVKGGGVPAINVIGYNRNVDWEELISRLQRITADVQPVIE